MSDQVISLDEDLEKAWEELEESLDQEEEVEPSEESKEPEQLEAQEPEAQPEEVVKEESTENVEASAEPPEGEKPEVEAKEPEPEPLDPPAELNSEEKEAFKKLPREGQEMTSRLAKSVRRHLTKVSEEAAATRRHTERLEQLEQSTQPMWGNAQGRSFEQWVQGMAQTQQLLNQNPVAGIQLIARQLGVDPQQLLQEQPTQALDPAISKLHSEVSQVKQHIASQRQAEEQAQQVAVLQELGQFMSEQDEQGGLAYPLMEIDTITGEFRHPDFVERVAIEAHLLKARNPGQSPKQRLAQAYENASYVNPTARQRSQASASFAERDKAKERVAKANKAARSLGSSPSTKVQVDSDMSLDEMIERSFA